MNLRTVVFLAALSLGASSVLAATAPAPSDCGRIVFTRDQVREHATKPGVTNVASATTAEPTFRASPTKDSAVYYPDINKDFVIKCFKSADAILFQKQDVDAQRKSIHLAKLDVLSSYKAYTYATIILGGVATLLLGFQALGKWIPYVALLPTTAVTVLTGLTQFEHQREDYIRLLSREGSWGRSSLESMRRLLTPLLTVILLSASPTTTSSNGGKTFTLCLVRREAAVTSPRRRIQLQS